MAQIGAPTQQFVPIKEIRDGVVVLKDGSLRAVLLASSVNLSLKSYDEEQAIIGQFQAFLNSLDFSLQIIVQSRRYDVRPYLLSLEERMREQTEPLLKVQTKEYIEFIRSFTEQNAIMKKYFYLVVPYNSVVLNTKGAAGKLEQFLPSSLKGSAPKKEGATEFEEMKSQLEQRLTVVEEGMARVGIRSARLGTEELIEVFYKWFNPGDSAQSGVADNLA
ncbi:hypothetical protein KC842_01170 [Candidatus Nomurabacteria bacterium]|nr:hypothetical protein [Candidatus Nomurabacteria bacterium]USN94675.1 MAG: hypothetical protein H6791_02875 [Candidatus Nomurabacteria bacterium]